MLSVFSLAQRRLRREGRAVANELDKAEAEAMLRRMHEHIKAADPVEPIAATIHPACEMRLLPRRSFCAENPVLRKARAA